MYLKEGLKRLHFHLKLPIWQIRKIGRTESKVEDKSITICKLIPFVPYLYPLSSLMMTSKYLKAVDQTVRRRENWSTFICSSMCKIIPNMLITKPQKNFHRLDLHVPSTWWENKVKWYDSFILQRQGPEQYNLMTKHFSDWGSGPDDFQGSVLLF